MRKRKKKCKNCHELFHPDYRNRKRQRFCEKPECRKVSKAYSQQIWLNKPENKDHFKGPENVQRVQEWRKANPGYSRKKPNTLQDPLKENVNVNQSVNPENVHDALQDFFHPQNSVIIGLIAQLTDTTLQENIAFTLQSMRQLGNDIIYKPVSSKGGAHDQQTTHMSQPYPKSTKTIQLGGSSPCT